jgi:triacylglycerol esterase/lipase EstA (alpha/beta hydrolase family)
VVFFHGLNGSYERTFQSSGTPPELWPHWLDDLGSEIAIWGVDYGAAASHWQNGDAMDLADRAQNLLPLVANRVELASGALVLIGYSLGGLVIKQLLRLANDERNTDARIGNFIRRVRKVGFLATPHFGSDQASLAVRPRCSFDHARRRPASVATMDGCVISIAGTARFRMRTRFEISCCMKLVCFGLGCRSLDVGSTLG